MRTSADRSSELMSIFEERFSSRTSSLPRSVWEAFHWRHENEDSTYVYSPALPLQVVVEGAALGRVYARSEAAW
jgi:hypothetical protein